MHLAEPLVSSWKASLSLDFGYSPGGIAGGDELSLKVRTQAGAAALLTTPGAAIVFDGALAETAYDVNLGTPVYGTLFASFLNFDRKILEPLRELQPTSGSGAVTLLPGLLLARYLGDSSEAARRYFSALWRILRPALTGRDATEPRIWRT